MKKIISVFLFVISATIIKAQVPDDALRNAWFIPGGTARNMAIGGAMGSLGGDITANNINPAGIGLYKTREIVITPGAMMNNNEFNYRGTSSSNSKTAFAYGATGVVIGTPRPKGNWTSTAFSISVNQLASFNNNTYYKGLNNFSSFSEQYRDELVRDGADTGAALSNYIFGSSLAYRTYLINDTLGSNGELLGYKTLVPFTTGTIQERNETTTGGYHEISFAFAGNLLDKLYLGASLNFPVVSYKRDLWYRETDATDDANNNFAFFQYNEHYTSSGFGVNAKLGLIYKLDNGFRLGFAIHTPSFMGFKDEIRSDMTTNTEAYNGLLSESSDNLNSGDPGQANYSLLTPWRIIVSGSYLFNAVENTKKQKGFITADIEYVNYRGARFNTSDEGDQTGKDYYKSLNNILKDYYKGAVNVRLGGELKFDPIAVRLGGAYYTSPYSDNVLKAHRLLAAGGIGYRKHGLLVDITYAYSINKDVNFPYRLNDKPNTFAEWDNKRGNIIVTFGIKI